MGSTLISSTQRFLENVNAASERQGNLSKEIPDTGLGMEEEKHGSLRAPASF